MSTRTPSDDRVIASELTLCKTPQCTTTHTNKHKRRQSYGAGGGHTGLVRKSYRQITAQKLNDQNVYENKVTHSNFL